MVEHCYSCNKYVTTKNYCGHCDYCANCCICNIPHFFNSKLEFHTPSRSQKKINSSQRFISAEIEVARIKQNRKLVENVVRKWKGSIVYDGTLPNGGFEINTAPAAGDLYIKQVTDICNKLEKAGASISAKCGLHVHLDARDYNYNDVARLVKLYAAIEPALFSMVPSSRHDTKYSVVCGDKLEKALAGATSHLELKEKIVTAIYGHPDSMSYRADKRGAGVGTGRYYALNLHSWFFRGTIECRLFDGTIDSDEIIAWGVMWANLLDFVLNSSDDEITKAVDQKKPIDSLLHVTDESLHSFIKKRYKKNVGAWIYRAKPKKIKFDDLFDI